MPTTSTGGDRRPRGGYPPPPERDYPTDRDPTDEDSWSHAQAMGAYLDRYPDAASDLAEFGQLYPDAQMSEPPSE